MRRPERIGIRTARSICDEFNVRDGANGPCASPPSRGVGDSTVVGKNSVRRAE
jgi:hypothetical protein